MMVIEQINKKHIMNFYKLQLEKFNKMGIGAITENDVKITEKLIEITEKRLALVRAMKPIDFLQRSI